LEFKGKVRHHADLAIGCDGIFSSLRKLSYPNDPPLSYLGVMVILGICTSSHPLCQERIFQSSDGHGRFYSMPFSKQEKEQNSMWQFSVPMEESRAVLFQKEEERAKKFMREYVAEWHEPIPTLVDETKLHSVMTLPAYDRSFS
jgi:2-polyprenyl-6-methoxyphenol hydroxylase-like FAD-dependent oxidoreductase